MDGLIIKGEWIDRIFDKNNPKMLEVRGFKTNKQGVQFYILESGSRKIRGTVKILCCIPVDEKNWEKSRPRHQVNITYEELLKIYKKPYYWSFTDAKEWEGNNTYNHPKGAVIWVKNVEITK